jgi:hypothetical protein
MVPDIGVPSFMLTAVMNLFTDSNKKNLGLIRDIF